MRSLEMKCNNAAAPAPVASYLSFQIAEDLNLSELLESAAGPALAAALERRAWRKWKRERERRARAAGRRSGTVCGRWSGRERVPDLRLSGGWLRAAGFDLGQAYEVEVRSGRLVIRAV